LKEAREYAKFVFSINSCSKFFVSEKKTNDEDSIFMVDYLTIQKMCDALYTLPDEERSGLY